jgi:hypothetical protein
LWNGWVGARSGEGCRARIAGRWVRLRCVMDLGCAMDLTSEEGRVLGCLVEKELTTPQQYPLTENALIAALIWWALNGQRLSRDSRGL